MRTKLVGCFCWIITAVFCTIVPAIAQVPIQGSVKGNTLRSNEFPLGNITFNE